MFRRTPWQLAALIALTLVACAEADDTNLGTATQQLSARANGPGLATAAATPGARAQCLVGQSGNCAQIDTITWEILLQSSSNHPLTDVWGPTPDHVLFVGWQSPHRPNRGRILEFDGATWNEDGTGPLATLNAISGSTTETFVVGTEGMIARSAGNGWVPMVTPTNADLNDIYVDHGNNAIAVGQKGTILELQGQTWKSLTSPTTKDLNAIWGSNGTSIIVGDEGTMAIVGNGSVVRAIPTGLSQNLNGIWGSNGTSIVVGDDGLFAFLEEGNLRAIPLGVPADLNSIWGSNGTSIVVVGKLGSIISVVVDTGSLEWEVGPKLTNEDLVNVWGDGRGTFYAVGADGTILRGKAKFRP